MKREQLRQRVLDICNGAGWVWDEDEQHFESDSRGYLEALGAAIQALERVFEIDGRKSQLRRPRHLDKYSHIDTLTDLVAEVIEQGES